MTVNHLPLRLCLSPSTFPNTATRSSSGYRARHVVAELRQMAVTPHVAQKSRHSAIDARTTRHPGHARSR